MKFLVIKPSSMGDIVHGLLVAQSIKSQLPEASITWVSRNVFAPLVRECACVDRVIPFYRRQGWKGFRKAVEEIRRDEYDTVLDLQGLARSGWMTFRARANRKYGRRDSREGASLFYRGRPALPPGGRHSHAVDILREFLPLLGLENRLELPLRFHRHASVAEEANGIDRPWLFFPSSRRPEKEWQRFTELTLFWLDGNPARRVEWLGHLELLAGPDLDTHPRFTNRTGKTTIPEMIRRMRQAAAVVANDSGPVHLAAALQVPVLAIHGPTEPPRFGPYPPGAPTNHFIRAPEGDFQRLSVEMVAKALETAGNKTVAQPE